MKGAAHFLLVVLLAALLLASCESEPVYVDCSDGVTRLVDEEFSYFMHVWAGKTLVLIPIYDDVYLDEDGNQAPTGVDCWATG